MSRACTVRTLAVFNMCDWHGIHSKLKKNWSTNIYDIEVISEAGDAQTKTSTLLIVIKRRKSAILEAQSCNNFCMFANKKVSHSNDFKNLP